MGYKIFDKFLEYDLTQSIHKSAVNLSGDENPVHTLENIVMGAHLLSLIEIYPEIKNHFISYIRVGFKSPVIADEKGNKITYEMKIKKMTESPFYNYNLEAKENGRTIMEGIVKTTDNKEIFEFETKKRLANIANSQLDEISDLKITPDMKKNLYCNILGMNDEDYKKYEERYENGTIRATMAPFFIPALIIGFLKSEIKNLDNRKKYFYGAQELEFYSDKIPIQGLKIVGKRPENLSQKSRCHIDLFVSGINGIVAKSRTSAMAI